MRRALYAAYAARCSTVVLGAWGCGVFRNRPEVVAELWSEVLDALEWRGRFARVVFAVPHGAHGRSLAGRLPPRASAAGPLIPFTCLYVVSVWVVSALRLRGRVFTEWALDRV